MTVDGCIIGVSKLARTAWLGTGDYLAESDIVTGNNTTGTRLLIGGYCYGKRPRRAVHHRRSINSVVGPLAVYQVFDFRAHYDVGGPVSLSAPFRLPLDSRVDPHLAAELGDG